MERSSVEGRCMGWKPMLLFGLNPKGGGGRSGVLFRGKGVNEPLLVGLARLADDEQADEFAAMRAEEFGEGIGPEIGRAHV